MERQHISAQVKRAVREQAQGRCEYCRSPADYASDPFTIEHIIPVSRRGTNKRSNLALSCFGCNLIKGNRIEAIDPATNQMAAFFNPRGQKWSEHFVWVGDEFEKVEGLTPEGRATANAFKLSREPLQNLRRILLNSNLHPPDD